MNKKQTKRNILKLNAYKEYAYTEIFKNASKNILAIIKKASDTNFNDYVFTKDATSDIVTVASIVYKDSIFATFSSFSNNKIKKLCDNALKTCIKHDIYTDLHTLKADKKLMYFESRFNLNSFMYQLAIQILTNGGSQAIEIDNK